MSQYDQDADRRGLFEVSRDPILVHDLADGRVVDANAAAERLLGYDTAALVGLHLDDLDIGDPGTESTLSAVDVSDVVDEALETGETRFQWQVEHADGPPRWVDVFMTRAQLRDEEHLLSFLRDVTDQHALTDDLNESRAALRELHDQQMADDAPAAKIRAMLDTGCRFLDMQYGCVARVDDDTWTVIHTVGEHDELSPGSAASFVETYSRLADDDEATDGLSSVHHASDELDDATTSDRFGLESFVGEQVTVNSDAYGVVCFADDAPRCRPFSEAERMFVDVVSGWVGTELERARRQTELDERQRRVDALFNAPSSFIGVLDPDGTLIEANETALRIGGVDAEDVLGEPFWETTWWSHDDALQARVRDAIDRANDGETVEFDATHFTPDGDERTVAAVVRPVVTDEGVETIVAHGVDVTDRDRRERELREQQQRLQTVLDNVPLVLFTVDADGEFTLSKGNALDRLGLAEDEVVGENAFDLYEDNEQSVDGLRRALNGERVAFETQLGDTFLRTWARPIRSDGDVTGAIGVSVDVTARHEHEERLSALSTATRRLMYPSTPDAVATEAVQIAKDVLDEPTSAAWSYDDDRDRLVPVAATDAALEAVGADSVEDMPTFGPGSHEYDAFDASGITVVEDYSTPDLAEPEHAKLGTVGMSSLGDHGVLAVGRREVKPYSDVERDLFSVLAHNTTAAVDRAEREQALEVYQRELERSNESLQQFAYVASHDLQEPLRMVSSYVDLLAREYGDGFDEDAEEYMAYAVDGANRMRSMLDALLTYSRVETAARDFEAVDVDSLVDDVRKNLELRLAETDASVTVADLPSVEGDRDQLGQVFQNLLKNAIEHAGDDTPAVRVWCEEREDAYAFAVDDDGVGIPDDQQDDIFGVFQTNHASASGDGTGIGLAVVDRVVHRHGGDVWVESEPGDGATFWFTIPKEQDRPVLTGDDA